jgi:hypothetical protein
MLKSIIRRHSAPVVPVIDSTMFTDIRPHPSPETKRGWKPMKVFPIIPVEAESINHVEPVCGPLFTPFIVKTIREGDIETLEGLLCNAITRIRPTKEMSTLAVQYGHLHIVKFLHHVFGLLPTPDGEKFAMFREDYAMLRFLKVWSNRKHYGSSRGLLI